MGLGNLIESIRDIRKERGALIHQLMESLIVRQVKEPPGPKSWLGVSRLPTLCPKSVVMAHRLKVQLIDEIDLKGRWRMDRGTALHLVIQELWLGPMSFLLGGWQCPKCAHVHGTDAEGIVSFRSAVPMPAACERCGTPNGKWTRFHFMEPEFRDFELYVSGKGDGLLHMAPNPIEALDIKTTEDLDKSYTRRDGTYVPSCREAPRDEHVGQLQWYLDAAGLHTGRILYVCPSAPSAEVAMAEHTVAYDPHYMHEQKEKVRALRQALEDDSRPVPPCPYGGAGPYGECTCVEVAVLWARSGL